MTLRLVQGFDWLPSSLSYAQYLPFLSAEGVFWNPVPSDPAVSLGAGVLAGSALFMGAGDVGHSPLVPMVQFTGVSVSSGVVGVRLFRGSTSTINPFFGIFDGSNTAAQLTVSFENYGIVKVWRGMPYTGVQLAQTPIVTFYNDVWFYCELGFTISSTVGTVTVKINAGVPAHDTGIVVALTGVNTQATSANSTDSVIWGTATPGNPPVTVNIGFDDMYMVDTAGSVNNTFLGNVKAQYCPPNAAGASTTFLIGGSAPAGTNWQSVLDKLLNEAQYVYSPTTGNYDLYGITPMITPGSIFGVQVRGAMRQDDATEIEGQNLISSSGVIAAGPTHLMSESYVYYKDIFELDPNTGLGWLAAAVNAAQIGPKKAA